MSEKIDNPQANAFGHIPNGEPIFTECPHKPFEVWSVDVDHDTGSTIPVVVEEQDLDALTQTFKDQCGMAVALRLIAQSGDGSMFADDGKHSADLSCVGSSLNENHQKMVQANENLNRLGKELGLDLTTATDAEILAALKAKQGSTADVQAANTQVQENPKGE